MRAFEAGHCCAYVFWLYPEEAQHLGAVAEAHSKRHLTDDLLQLNVNNSPFYFPFSIERTLLKHSR